MKAIENLRPPLNPLAGALAFDYAGIRRPARNVPCNFLDIESHLSGDPVFAIGDTCLIPNPLPVLCIQHYLHRSPLPSSAKPLQVAEEINSLIYDCCEADCSLTCFYALYQRASKVLRYVNAGHHAPVLIRTHPDEVLRLEMGGPVFGLQHSPRYVEGFVQLKAGDRLVAFTHGVIESLAAKECQSAERLLVSLARTHKRATAAQIANRIVAACESEPSPTPLDGSVLVVSVDSNQESVYHSSLEAEALLVGA